MKKIVKVLISRLQERTQKRTLRLIAIKDYPLYFGRTVRPDTFFWAKIYFHVVKFMHIRDYQKRKSTARLLATANDQNISPENGYLLDDLSKNEVVIRAMEFCHRTASDINIKGDEHAKTAKKPFLVNHFFDITQKTNAPILDLACNAVLLSPISEYIGMIPVLQSAQLWYSPNTHFYGRSQMYHMDAEDYRQIKCYIFLDEVDRDSGPLTIIPAAKSRKVYKKLRQKGLTIYRNEKIRDEEIYSATSTTSAVQMIGEPGTVAFVDTCSCYHFGSRPGKRPRFLLHLHYYSPYSMEMPLWGRRFNQDVLDMNQHREDRQVRNLVLGLSHLNFPELRRRKESGRRENVV